MSICCQVSNYLKSVKLRIVDDLKKICYKNPGSLVIPNVIKGNTQLNPWRG